MKGRRDDWVQWWGCLPAKVGKESGLGSHLKGSKRVDHWQFEEKTFRFCLEKSQSEPLGARRMDASKYLCREHTISLPVLLGGPQLGPLFLLSTICLVYCTGFPPARNGRGFRVFWILRPSCAHFLQLLWLIWWLGIRSDPGISKGWFDHRQPLFLWKAVGERADEMESGLDVIARFGVVPLNGLE